MVAMRHLLLLAALAIAGGAAKYDIFDVIEKLTTLTKQDIIDRIKASEQASRLGVKNDDVIRLNGPLWSKFQTLRARLQTMTRAEQTVVRTLFSIARDVLERRTTDADVSERIVEAFQNGGQGLYTRYPRVPTSLCPSTVQTTIPGGHPATTDPSGHPATTGPSASSDENLEDLFDALQDAASTTNTVVSDPFKNSLNRAQKFQQAKIDINCSVTCSAGESSFPLHGHLHFVTDAPLQNDLSRTDHRAADEKGFNSFIKESMSLLSDKIASFWSTPSWKTIIVFIVVVFTLIQILRLLCKQKFPHTPSKKKW